MKNAARKKGINQIWENNPGNKEKKRKSLDKPLSSDKEVKAVLREAADKRKADKIINELMKLSKGSLVKILPVTERRYPLFVLKRLIERIERKWEDISHNDRIAVLEAKAFLEKKQNG